MSSTVLENGITVSDLTTAGSVLSIDANYQRAYEDDFAPEIDKDLYTKGCDTLGTPIVCTFKELAQYMINVSDDGLVKKKFLKEGGGLPISEDSFVKICYSGYLEGAKKPFDMQLSKPLEINLKNDSSMLLGLRIAVLSMLVGEESLFLISYKLLYGELGLPDVVGKKADCAFYIRLQRCTKNPAEDPNSNFDTEQLDRNCFKRVIIEAKKLYLIGVDFYNKSNYSFAIKSFHRAVNMLHHCRLADEHEEHKQEQYLIRLYTNLAICYNKIKVPLKVCTMCNEIKRLTNIWKNPKVLVQNARALKMISEFDQAEKMLNTAKRLCEKENLEEIMHELSDIQSRRNAKILGEDLIAKMSCNNVSDQVSDTFKAEINNICQALSKDSDSFKATLRSGLCDIEIEYVKAAAQSFGFKILVSEKDVSLNKNSGNVLLNGDILEQLSDINI